MHHSLGILLWLLPAAGAAQTPPPPAPREAALPETVSVSGVGRATVEPDRVGFTVGVESMSPSLDLALQDNNTRVAAVIAALKKQGATDKEVRTSHVSVSPQHQYSEGRRPRIVGFQVVNNVTVTRDKTEDVGRLLQAALDAGANQVSGVSFTVSDPARGRNQGLQAAFADARAKAEVLAAAAGRALGRALSITEGAAVFPRPPVPVMARMSAEMAQADVPIEPGTEELSFTVSVVFELR